MGNDGLKSSSKHNNLRTSNHHQSLTSNAAHQQQQQQHQIQASTKDDDDIEFTIKPQSRMSKIRRSLSFRKKKNKKEAQHQQQPIVSSTSVPPATASAILTSSNATTASVVNKHDKYTIDTSKPTSWQEDERKVREGTCSFHVKYLGSIEVFDSRGMHICEQAIERQISVS